MIDPLMMTMVCYRMNLVRSFYGLRSSSNYSPADFCSLSSYVKEAERGR